MSFQNPAALWALLPLGAAIVALYLLRMRRRDLRVPATFLWPARTDEVRANSLFQRLRFSWLLVLQLLALAAFAFALARPQLKQEGLIGNVTLLVVDSSASMGAKEGGLTRLEEAKRLAAEAIRSAGAGDRIAVLEAGPQPRVVSALSQDPTRSLDSLRLIRQTDAESDVGEALRLAAALAEQESSARIVLLSDGVFEPIEDFAPGRAEWVYRPIGSTVSNLAIRALGVSRTPSGHQIYCAVAAWGDAPLRGELSLYADGKLFDAFELSPEPGKEWGRVVPLPAGTQILEAKLKAPGDALAADDYAVTLTDPRAALRVLLLTRGNLFLERALALDPRVTLDKAATLPEAAKPESPGPAVYDVAVFDGVPETAVKARGILTFAAAGPNSPVVVEGTLTRPEAISQEQHPLLLGVSLRGAYFETARKVRAKGPSRTIATARGDDPLLVVDDTGSQRRVYAAFDLLQSDFPLQVGFPIFVANALDFLGGTQTEGALAIRAGQTLALPADRAATWTAPDGTETALLPEDGLWTVRDTSLIGTYTLRSGETVRPVYAQLRSERESSLRPASELRLGDRTVEGATTPAQFADFWRPLLLLCLGILAAEWWLYMRRS